jgi:hypothetical protein
VNCEHGTERNKRAIGKALHDVEAPSYIRAAASVIRSWAKQNGYKEFGLKGIKVRVK